MGDIVDALDTFQESLSNYMNARRAYDTCIKHMQIRLISMKTGNERFPALLETRTTTAKRVRENWVTLKKDMRVAIEYKSF